MLIDLLDRVWIPVLGGRAREQGHLPLHKKHGLGSVHAYVRGRSELQDHVLGAKPPTPDPFTRSSHHECHLHPKTLWY